MPNFDVDPNHAYDRGVKDGIAGAKIELDRLYAQLVDLRRKHDTVVLEKQYLVAEITKLYRLIQLDDYTVFEE